MAKTAVKSKVKPKEKPALKKKAAVRKTKSSASVAPARAPQEELKTRLRINLRAYDHKVIDSVTRQIVEAALRQNSEINGPIPLPTETKRYTVNRSTFVHKDARDQFEVRVHRRLIIVPQPSPRLVSALTSLTLPTGVDIEIKSL